MLTDMWFLVLLESLCHIGLSHLSYFSNWEWNTKCEIFSSPGVCLTSLASTTTSVILNFPAPQQQEPWLIQGACFFPSASSNGSPSFQRMARVLLFLASLVLFPHWIWCDPIYHSTFQLSDSPSISLFMVDLVEPWFIYHILGPFKLTAICIILWNSKFLFFSTMSCAASLGTVTDYLRINFEIGISQYIVLQSTPNFAQT